MSTDVRFQVAQLTKGLLANGTRVGPLSGMLPLVNVERRRIWKDLPTCGTFMTAFPSGLCVFVRPLVQLKGL